LVNTLLASLSIYYGCLHKLVAFKKRVNSLTSFCVLKFALQNTDGMNLLDEVIIF